MNKVIGQDHLVQDLKQLFSIFKNSNGTIRPNFFLTGESGSGKTLTIKTLCKLNELDYLEINAAQLTKEGTSGNSLSKALSPMLEKTGRMTVVFVDEFDKLFISGNSNSQLSHETTNGVQNEFLKVLEGTTTQVFGDYGKYFAADVSQVLFVFCGAFNNEKNVTIDKLREFGIKTEFLGRVSLVFSTRRLSLEDLLTILHSNTLLDQYLELFEVDREEVLQIMGDYITKHYAKNTLGARQIDTMIHQYFIKGKLDDKSVENITFQNRMQLIKK